MLDAGGSKAPFLLYVLLTILLILATFAKGAASPVSLWSKGLNKGYVAIVLVFFFIQVIGLFRGYLYGAMDVPFFTKFILFILSTVAAFISIYWTRDTSKKQYLKFHALFSSVSLYVVTNFVMYMLGFETGKELSTWGGLPDSVLMSVVGINTSRVFFPLSSGLNSFALVAGMSLVYSVSMLGKKKLKLRFRTLAAISVLISLVSLVLVDARMIFIVTFLVMVYGLFRLTTQAKMYRALLLVSAFLPGMLVFAAGIVIEKLDTSSLSRNSGNSGVVTINGRTEIWDKVYDEIKYPKILHIVGYGAKGQITSGISKDVAQTFSATAVNKDEVTVHNYILQTFLDAGYLGLLVLFAVLYRASGRAKNRKIINAWLLLFLLGGVTESAPMMYSPDLYFIFIAVLISIGAECHRERNWSLLA